MVEKSLLETFFDHFYFVLAAAKLVGNMRHFVIDVDEPFPEDIRLDISS